MKKTVTLSQVDRRDSLKNDIAAANTNISRKDSGQTSTSFDCKPCAPGYGSGGCYNYDANGIVVVSRECLPAVPPTTWYQWHFTSDLFDDDTHSVNWGTSPNWDGPGDMRVGYTGCRADCRQTEPSLLSRQLASR